MTTVYTLHGCQPCAATKRKLTALGVAFTERPASDLPAGIDATQAPVVVLADGTWFDGYRPDKLEAAA